nr:MAG TPA: hypothetical protein [Caudoviricetes sp.]
MFTSTENRALTLCDSVRANFLDWVLHRNKASMHAFHA